MYKLLHSPEACVSGFSYCSKALTGDIPRSNDSGRLKSALQRQWRFLKGDRRGMFLASPADRKLGYVLQNYANRHLGVDFFPYLRIPAIHPWFWNLCSTICH